MTKNALILSASLLIAGTSYGQKVNLTWSQESKNDVDFSSFVAGDNGDLIKLCFEQKGSKVLPIMTGYNAKLQELAWNTIQVTEDNVKFNSLLSLNNNLFFYTNIYDKKAKNTTFYCQQLDNKTFRPVGQNLNLGTFEAFKKSEQSTVNYSLSEDSSKVLMMGLSPYSKTDAEKYYISVYDTKMNKIWDNTVELPYKDKYIENLGRIVTNDGKVAIIIKHFDQETLKNEVRRDGKKVPSYTTKVLLFSKGEAKPHEFIIDIADRFVHQLSLAEENGNELMLFGLYKQKSGGYVNGYFTTKINTESKKVSVGNLNAFPAEFLELIHKDKQGDDGDKDGGLGNYFAFVKSLQRANGDRDFLIEYQRVTFVSTKYSSYYVYTNGDIIDINIKKDGTTVLTRIPKIQTATVTDDYGSFKALTYNDNLVLFYNDRAKNAEQSLDERPKGIMLAGSVLGMGESPALLMATVDGKGNLNRSVLMDKTQTKYLVAVNSSISLGKNKVALYAKRGRKDMVGLLELK